MIFLWNDPLLSIHDVRSITTLTSHLWYARTGTLTFAWTYRCTVLCGKSRQNSVGINTHPFRFNTRRTDDLLQCTAPRVTAESRPRSEWYHSSIVTRLSPVLRGLDLSLRLSIFDEMSDVNFRRRIQFDEQAGVGMCCNKQHAEYRCCNPPAFYVIRAVNR